MYLFHLICTVDYAANVSSKIVFAVVYNKYERYYWTLEGGFFMGGHLNVKPACTAGGLRRGTQRSPSVRSAAAAMHADYC